MGQNFKNSYLHHRGVLEPHIWGGGPWPTYLSNDPKLERFRDFATPNFTAPTIIPTVKALITVAPVCGGLLQLWGELKLNVLAFLRLIFFSAFLEGQNYV